MDLYRHVPPPGDNIPVSVEPSQLEDSVPTEDKIEWAVKWLRNHFSRGGSRAREEYLKWWLSEARNEEAEAVKSAAAEETVAVIRGPEGEAMED